jgi:hypothetical protein
MIQTYETRAHPKSHTDRSQTVRRRNLYSYKQLILVTILFRTIPRLLELTAIDVYSLRTRNTNSISAILCKPPSGYEVTNLNAPRVVIIIGFNYTSLETSSYRSIYRPSKMLLDLKASVIF